MYDQSLHSSLPQEMTFGECAWWEHPQECGAKRHGVSSVQTRLSFQFHLREPLASQVQWGLPAISLLGEPIQTTGSSEPTWAMQ